MSLSIRSIRAQHPFFAGEVSGVDISRPLTRDEAAAIDAGMDHYAVLVFRGQQLTDEQQIAFTPQLRRAGERPPRQRPKRAEAPARQPA